MYFSSREIQILQLLIDYQEPISQDDLVQILGVSKRTVYREMASIEKSLITYELKLIKIRAKGYQLIGESENIERLKKDLTQNSLTILGNIERQSAIAASLLLSNEELIIESLALTFNVNASTVHSDLQVIEDSLKEYDLTLERKKGVGITISGGEKERRQILNNLIYNGVSEYDFFNYLDEFVIQEETTVFSTFFLELIQSKAWKTAKVIVFDQYSGYFVHVTDNQLQRVMIIIALMIDRITAGHELEHVGEQEEATISELTKQIVMEIEKNSGLQVNQSERTLLFKQLEGVNYKKPQNIFIDQYDVELSYKIKEFIKLMSVDTMTGFEKDNTLFFDLLTHMSAAIKRSQNQFQEDNSPFIGDLVKKYPLLFESIEKNLKVIFPEITFSEQEVLYVVLHFASSVERYPENREFSVLVFCSSGIGTSRILENRLKRYIPEISEIRVERLSRVSQVSLKSYDLILSTVYLPGFSLPYKIISPLLLDDEIEEVKEGLRDSRQLSQKVMAVKVEEQTDSKSKFELVYEKMQVANNLLEQFNIVGIHSSDSIGDTMKTIISDLKGSIHDETEKVTELVIKRYKEAPIGIPNSSIALFHSSNDAIQHPFFGIYDLDKEFTIISMDKKTIHLKRILLMLAPQPLTESEQEVLGLISASIIENDLNLDVYQHGNTDEVYNLLSHILLDVVKKLD